MSSPELSGANAFVLQTQVEDMCMGSHSLFADLFFMLVSRLLYGKLVHQYL